MSVEAITQLYNSFITQDARLPHSESVTAYDEAYS
jgi:hypothetical protein